MIREKIFKGNQTGFIINRETSNKCEKNWNEWDFHIELNKLNVLKMTKVVLLDIINKQFHYKKPNKTKNPCQWTNSFFINIILNILMRNLRRILMNY